MPTKKAKTALQYLSNHMYTVYSAVQSLVDFFSEVFYENWPAAETKAEEIKKHTTQAQTLQQKIAADLPKERMPTISRANIITLLQMQTKIANKAQDITGLVIGRQLKIPSTVGTEYFSLLNKNIMAVQQTYLLINSLSDLTHAPDKTEVMQQLTTMIEQLDVLENVTDQLQVRARQALFTLEKELPAVDVITLYKLLEWTGDLADNAHHLGGQLVTILAN